jgi:hypothetical protein
MKNRRGLHTVTAKGLFLALLVCVLYALHQDLLLWRTARPLAFGFLPVGLLYHALYTLACSVLMIVLCRYAWPSHLDRPEDGDRR